MRKVELRMNEQEKYKDLFIKNYYRYYFNYIISK